MNLVQIFIVYIIVMNIVGFAIMGYDKHQAKVHKWRVPELRLFLVSLIGGSIGTWSGMYFYRHKTKHWYFAIGMPLIAILHLILLVIGITKW